MATHFGVIDDPDGLMANYKHLTHAEYDAAPQGLAAWAIQTLVDLIEEYIPPDGLMPVDPVGVLQAIARELTAPSPDRPTLATLADRDQPNAPLSQGLFAFAYLDNSIFESYRCTMDKVTLQATSASWIYSVRLLPFQEAVGLLLEADANVPDGDPLKPLTSAWAKLVNRCRLPQSDQFWKGEDVTEKTIVVYGRDPEDGSLTLSSS